MHQKRQTTPLGWRPARRITYSGAIQTGKNESVSLDFSIKTKLPGIPETEAPGNAVNRSLFCCRSAHGANIRAAAALRADIGIDDVFAITLRNRGNGAFCLARTASDAFVRNFVCHEKAPPLYVRIYHSIFSRKINWKLQKSHVCISYKEYMFRPGAL